MKLISLLSAFALFTLGASLLDLPFNAYSLGLYAVAASTLILLGVVRDYAPRRYWQPHATVVPFARATAVRHENRLAA